MFAKKQRYSFRNGLPSKVFSTPYLVVRYKTNDTEGFKCSVVVGKKVDKRAVVRNRTKRLIAKNIKELLGDDKKITLVIYARPKILEIKDEEIKEELVKIFREIKIL